MQKKKMNNRNQGITLVALIITMIIMLLLVGVTITVTLNGGLFKTAKDAEKQTELEKDKEVEYANIESNLTENELIDKYTGAEGKPDVWDGTSVDTSWYNNTDTEFHIKTAAELAGLAKLIDDDVDRFLW